MDTFDVSSNESIETFENDSEESYVDTEASEESESVSDNEETVSEVIVDNSTNYSYDFTNLETIGFLILVSVLGFGCMLSFVLGLNTK